MKLNILKAFLPMTALSLCLYATTGCNDTAKGMEKDSQENSAAAAESAAAANENMKEAAGDVGAAATLTPMIKSAIVANPILNDNGNMIDVDSTDNGVRLKGTVISEEVKKMAEQMAAKIMAENKSDQKLINELVVRPN